MTDQDALLAAVLASPEEDAPRLAYADWCEDHGEPDRAEFIRLQIKKELIVGNGRLAKQKRLDISRKCKELEQLSLDNTNKWVPKLEKESNRPLELELIMWENWYWTGRPACQYRRGFLERFVMSSEFWLSRCDELLAHYPICEVEIMTPLQGQWEGDSASDVVYKFNGYERTVTYFDIFGYEPAFNLNAPRHTEFIFQRIFNAFWPTIKQVKYGFMSPFVRHVTFR